MRKIVGISQKIKRSWMDAVLDHLVQTDDEAELRVFLDEYLKADLPGKESRAKAAGIVLRIWSGCDLWRRALQLLPRISGRERIWLHWGMAALAYPFFRDTAEVVGRLQTLQDDFTTAQAQARMLTAWGDRSTNKEAVQKLITSMLDWEVLQATKTKGRFVTAPRLTTDIMDLQLWLLEALLTASAADEIEVQHLLRLPALFPFRITASLADLRRNERFTIHRQGLNMDMAALSKINAESRPTSVMPLRKSNAAERSQLSLFSKQGK
ncbi:MAG: hypothetical protein SF339_04810 [Blastocatellia bacterium]|nr:hypothetical protein [Blastocatellia bacterium]